MQQMSQTLVSQIIYLELLLILRSNVGDAEEKAVTTEFVRTACT